MIMKRVEELVPGDIFKKGVRKAEGLKLRCVRGYIYLVDTDVYSEDSLVETYEDVDLIVLGNILEPLKSTNKELKGLYGE